MQRYCGMSATRLAFLGFLVKLLFRNFGIENAFSALADSKGPRRGGSECAYLPFIDIERFAAAIPRDLQLFNRLCGRNDQKTSLPQVEFHRHDKHDQTEAKDIALQFRRSVGCSCKKSPCGY